MTSHPAAVPGVVSGGLRILLRLEGAAVFAAALLAYAFLGESWRLFALLFLFDRALGYGLKYGTAFGDTHLGQLGRQRPKERTRAIG